MINVHNFVDNDDVMIGERGGPFKVLHYKRDLSCNPADAQTKWFMAQMGVQKKQLLCTLNNESVIIQKGAMQLYGGAIEQTTGLKGVGDFFKKSIAGSVTGEAGIKPEYKGTGLLVTEPTYRHYLVENLACCPGWFVCCCTGQHSAKSRDA